MIACFITWLILFLFLLIFILQENINGSKGWRFAVSCILVFIIIFIPIITITEYWSSYKFYWDNVNFVAQANEGLTESQEYAILGRVINYNYELYRYKNRFHKLGIFAPEYQKIKTMPFIQLTSFNMENYKWWE